MRNISRPSRSNTAQARVRCSASVPIGRTLRTVQLLRRALRVAPALHLGLTVDPKGAAGLKVMASPAQRTGQTNTARGCLGQGNVLVFQGRGHVSSTTSIADDP